MFKGLFKKDAAAKTNVNNHGREQRCYEVAGDIFEAIMGKIQSPSEFNEITISESSGAVYYEDNNGNESTVYQGVVTHSQAVALEWILWNELRKISPYKAYYGGDGTRVHHRPNRPNDGDYMNVNAPEI